MKTSSLQSGSILTLEMVEILRHACESPKTRRAALRDPRSLLSRNGIELADGCDLHLFEHAPRRGTKPTLRDHKISEPIPRRGDVEPPSQLPPGYQARLDELWGPTHGGCPFPLQPYKVKKKVTTCLIKGVWSSGKEWVGDGNSGHFEPANVTEFCALELVTEVDVTECR
jgi:hypothetical protein